MHALPLQELDLQLIHALQIAPRISWSEAGRILGASAQALAARWERLRANGFAWVAVHPGGTYQHQTTALIEVDCRAGAQREVVQALCADPRVVTVEESTQGYDLLLTVMTADMSQMSRFVVDDLATMTGVAGRRTYVATAVHRDGSSWRLDALDPARVRALENVARRARRATAPGPPPAAWPLIQALSGDGRRTAAEIADLVGRNPATVRRQLPRLLASGMLSIRCEVAHTAARRPISCTWRARLRPADRARTVAALHTLPHVRLCMSTTGDANLLITAWTPDLARILEIEQVLGDRLPWLELRDSGINLRTSKRVGWLLDERGCATGEVVTPIALRPT
ncbi:Lrp/AsnC family transcriptional regulator [Mycobacterium sp. C3-094]|uniref:Lrp/AsnC family transcriptional regulator n=1 Tax=Mycobacterium sp. PSTR-4-N TaxID=2917745 RepID=UPI001F14FC4D|nr:Lrp/AsnC family transcriptional regulator [Mycobacterium sp. PSTR-4-N]MCG7595953.1 Lrp/AsnC family transcriptional regulator [Mycobacterium sp. PSTR-4-N]